MPNYATISAFLKDKPWNSVDGQMYGIPHGWGANLLMYNTDVVKNAPDSWGAVFAGRAGVQGQGHRLRLPHLHRRRRAVPVEDQARAGHQGSVLADRRINSNAAADLLKEQHANIGEYWSDYTKAVQAFESGTSVIGTTWQVIANMIDSDNKVKVDTVLPKEGSTGWSDTWMVSSKATHPNCMYKWMDWITSPEVNAQVAEYFGEAPAQTKACEFTSDKDFCATYHATDAAYAEQDPLLDDAAEAVRGRQRQQLHGLQRVGRQVAADQGVIGRQRHPAR